MNTLRFRPSLSLLAILTALALTKPAAAGGTFLEDAELHNAGTPDDYWGVRNGATLTGSAITGLMMQVGSGPQDTGHAILSNSDFGTLKITAKSSAELTDSRLGNVSADYADLTLRNVTVAGSIAMYSGTLTFDNVNAGGGLSSGSSVVNMTDSHFMEVGGGRSLLTSGTVTATRSSFTATLPGSAAVDAGGGSRLFFSGSTLSGATVIRAGHPILNGGDVTVNLTAGSVASATGQGWLMDVSDGYNVSLLIDASQATGNIRVQDGGSATVTVQNGSSLTGALEDLDRLSLSNSAFTLTGSSTVGTLETGGSDVIFRHVIGFSTLQAGTLSGGGTFHMNTNVAAMTGDFLEVAGEATGSYTLDVTNTGREPGMHDSVLALVRTGGGDATFSLKNGAVDIGAWQYRLVKVGNEWGLAQPGQPVVIVEPVFGDPGEVTVRPIEQPEVPGVGEDSGPATSASTDAVLSLASAGKELFYGELNALNGRNRDLQTGTQRGVWGTFLNNTQRLQGSWNSAYRLEQNGLMLGGDTSQVTAAGQLTTGAFVSSSSGRVKHARGGESHVDSWGGGLYATLSGAGGWYASSVAKVNRDNTDLSARMTDGEGVSGSWHAWGYGLALEGGREFSPVENVSITPYASLTGYRNQSRNVSLSNGMQADLGNGQSLQGELGVRSGVKLAVGATQVTPYLKAAVTQEFAKSAAVRINDAYNFDNNYRGTSGHLSGGISADITPAARVWVEAGYAKGEHNESPLSASLGVRVGF